MKINWVQQLDDAGCGIAVCAMLTNQSYEQTKTEMVNIYHGGLDIEHIDAYLSEKGYFVRRFYKLNSVTEEIRQDWPAFPSKICIASVIASSESDKVHYVLVINGIVYDPATVTIKNLNEYVKVIWIAGVIKPLTRKSKQKQETQANQEGTEQNV